MLSVGKKNEWLQWAAFNRVSGVKEDIVRLELARAGLASDDIELFLGGLDADPVFRAALQCARRARLANDLNDALLDIESSAFDLTQITRVSSLSSQDFHERFYALNRPVIITDIVGDWPASTKWSVDFLRRHYGEYDVTYQKGRSPHDHRDSFVDHTVTAPFRVFLDEVMNVADDEGAPYLIAHDRLLDRPEFRPLLQDVRFDPRYLNDVDDDGEAFFWIGPARAATPMHRDLGNVFMAQVTGRKRIKLVPSRQLHLVYNEHGYHSDADFANLSFDDYPLLKKAHIMDFILAPGEFLFVPVGWWHHVEALNFVITVTGNNFRGPNKLRPIFD
jgi:hypothetical protein